MSVNMTTPTNITMGRIPPPNYQDLAEGKLWVGMSTYRDMPHPCANCYFYNTDEGDEVCGNCVTDPDYKVTQTSYFDVATWIDDTQEHKTYKEWVEDLHLQTNDLFIRIKHYHNILGLWTTQHIQRVKERIHTPDLICTDIDNLIKSYV